MTRPPSLKTKIFIDGGLPEETKEVIKLLGFLDGQTTNPTLIAKHPSFLACQTKGEKCTEENGWKYYKEIVSEISPLVKNGSVSIEVYADRETRAEKMVAQGLKFFKWIPNAHIKLPITAEGLKAAAMLIGKGIRVNMTLCFSQEQAAAVYSATRGAKKGEVFVSPFIGRLYDLEENGLSLIKNILKMYKKGDGHVEVLTASVRSLDHFLAALALGSDIITSPAKILKEWAEKGFLLPDKMYRYKAGQLKEIPYKDINLLKDWKDFNIAHELTAKGIERFAKDWNDIII